MWKQLKIEVVFSLHTHVPTTKQKIVELKGRPLAFFTPRQNKQINEVWVHLLSPAMPCHQHCVRSGVMTCGEPPQELALASCTLPAVLFVPGFMLFLGALCEPLHLTQCTDTAQQWLMAPPLFQWVKTGWQKVSHSPAASAKENAVWVTLHRSFCPLPQLPFTKWESFSKRPAIRNGVFVLNAPQLFWPDLFLFCHVFSFL